jgi:hypothetical protein
VFTDAYVPGSNNISVYLNGLRQAPGDDFLETSTTSVTFTSSLASTDKVIVVIGQQINESVGAQQVGYTPSGTGAVATNVQAKLREFVSVKDFGAIGDGVTDDTAAIQNCLNAAPEGSRVIFPPAHYYFTNLSSSKSLVLDFQGSDLTVAPGIASLSSASPALKFEGVRGTRYALSAAANDQVTLASAGDAANFAAGDYVELRDLEFVPGWDDTAITAIAVTGGGSGYTNNELVRIVGGAGSNAWGTVTVSAGAVTAVTLTSGGVGFAVSDTVTLDAVDGTGTGATGTVASIDGGVAAGFTGHSEINRIRSISSGVLTLEKAIEWPYQGASATVAKLTTVVEPQILNVGTVNEIDPGGTYTGTSSSGPHIFAFYHCVSPVVSGATVDGFQLHAVQFTLCLNPLVERVTARNPFRPTIGGHGYLMQFDRCTGGIARMNIGSGVRHLVDWTQSYDCVSQSNIGYSPAGAVYYCHGQGAKRATSIDDVVYYRNASQGGGWQSGNPAFSADYDFTVVRPRAYGGSNENGVIFSAACLSERFKVIEPFVQLAKTAAGLTRVFFISSGTRDTVIEGGFVDLSQVSGNVSDSFLTATPKTATSNPIGISPVNISIKGTIVKAPSSGSSSIIVCDNAAGYLRLFDIELEGNSNTQSAIRVNTAMEEIEIKGHRLSGTLQYGVRIVVAPFGRYRVLNGQYKGTYAIGTPETLAASSLLIQGENDTLFKEFTVANLPTGRRGLFAYATNGRKNGEGVGAGTGVPVFHDGTAWRAFDTGATVAA